MSYQYALTNHTNLQYSLPVAGLGSLMRRIPENKALDRFDDSSWDNSLIIPPGQTFNVKFNVIYKLSDYNIGSSLRLSGRASHLSRMKWDWFRNGWLTTRDGMFSI
jgi:hypothetical protein